MTNHDRVQVAEIREGVFVVLTPSPERALAAECGSIGRPSGRPSRRAISEDSAGIPAELLDRFAGTCKNRGAPRVGGWQLAVSRSSGRALRT